MDELNPSNLNTIIGYLSGAGPTPSAADEQFLIRNIVAGMPAGQAFDLGSQAGMTNTFLNPQERYRNGAVIKKLRAWAD